MQADLAGLARHGGRVDAAARRWPDAPRPWLDLSTGINPEPWVMPAGLEVDLGPLPTPSALAELEAAAAGYLGTVPERVAAVPGSEVALRMLGALGLPRPVAAVPPCYGTHLEVADTVGEGATVLVANPNNPDGRLLAELPRAEWITVDEAFADAVPEVSLIPRINDDGQVIVFRSFGKFFGLAGLRLGFVVGPRAVVARMRELLGDWPVSAHAIAYGTLAYRDAAWIAATRVRLRERADALDVVLRAAGLDAEGPCPLFRLVRTPEWAGVLDRLGRAGVLVRPFPELGAVRFGVPTAAGLERLARALGG
jgi:cobalamin biosynthesis protein CobC